MNIYYTAKDIEEMAARGMKQLEIGSGVTLTDFARETAQQLNIALVDSRKSVVPETKAAPPRETKSSSSKYNKPTGCMHGPNSQPAVHSQAETPSNQAGDSNTVNRLIDLMGKVIKRGD